MTRVSRPVASAAPHTLIAIAALLISIAGCATFDRAAVDVEQALREWSRPSASRVQFQPSRESEPASPSAEAAGSAAAVAPGGVDLYVHEALARNPGIQAAMADARAMLQRIPQVSSLPDPMIRAIVRPEPIQTAAGDVYFTLGASQTFPLLRKLELAGHVAAAETRVALERLNERRFQLVADVERAYWQIYRLDRNLEITAENRRVLGDLQGVIETQYQVGKVPQQDLLRVQTELAKLGDDENRFRIRRLAAAAVLNQLADQRPQRGIPVTAIVDVPAIDGDVDDLIALSKDHNPALAVLAERIERDRERIKLADLGYWPDLTLGFEWNYLEGRDAFIPPVNPMTGMRPAINRHSEGGDDNWAVTAQMNLPIWGQRVEAAKREARQRLVATQSELLDASNVIAFRVFDAWSRVQAQQHTLVILESELIPRSRQTYEVTLTAYQAGKSDFLALIDNWRRWLDFQLMWHQETVDLETAFSDLQREVGLQLVGAGADLPEGE